MTAANEAVADVAEEVAEQALHVAAVSRGLSGRTIGIALGTFLLGSGIGGGVSYILSRRILEAKYSKIADDEIEEMRKHYEAKKVALESDAAKRPVSEIVAERGYVSPEAETNVAPPMAVPPPQAKQAPPIDLDAPENAHIRSQVGEPEVHRVFEEAEAVPEWDWHKERSRRSPNTPYVIHYDEVHEFGEAYSQETLTYYEEDDVLCNERDEIVDLEDRDRIVGEKNLERFGHGSNDESIVYVRNDELEIVYEVVKSPNSYSEEVHGIKHDDDFRGNLRRMRERELYDADD